MKQDEVDFNSPLFDAHPPGWQSPADLAEGFILAWALEVRERLEIDSRDPFGAHVGARLSPTFRYDTLGGLLRVPAFHADASPAAPIGLGRLTTMSIAWSLFDLLNVTWRLQPGDLSSFGNAISEVTGDSEGRSVFGSLGASFAKCLIADRVKRVHLGESDLTFGEQWAASGDPDLLVHHEGFPAVPFVIGYRIIPIAITRDVFAQSVWSSVRVFVERTGHESCIEAYGHRTAMIRQILDAGGRRIEDRRKVDPTGFMSLEGWSGWPTV